MGFWIYMTCMACLIPITMIGFGRYFIKTAPKKINYIFGYRTSRSMKSESTWVFAHKYCGRIWFICGSISLISSLAIMFFVFGKDTDTVGCVGAACMFLQITEIIISIIATEKALKKNFDN